MPTLKRFHLLFVGLTAIILIAGQNCTGFGPSLKSGLALSESAALQSTPTCPSGQAPYRGRCQTVQSVSLAAAAKTTVPFGSGFQKFVYSAALPGPVNFVGLSGNVEIDSNSALFSEALFTVGYVPSGQCPSSGSTYMSYDDLFNSMPGSVILEQHIVKILGGHLQLAADNLLPAPVSVSGCAYIILDGSAAFKNSYDVMTSTVNFNFVGGPANTVNSLMGGPGGEFCTGTNAGCTTSSTNQFAIVQQITSPARLLSIVGSVSNAALAIYKNAPPPTGDWTTRNLFFIDPDCAASSVGVSTNQDFFAKVPANAIPVLDMPQKANGSSVAQQSFSTALNIMLNAGDCFVELIQANGNGAIDLETQIHANVTSNVTSGVGANANALANAGNVQSMLAPNGEVAIYRYGNGQGVNLYAKSATAVVPRDYALVGADPAFIVYDSQVAGSIALQRCYQGTWHFLSVDPNCEGSSISPYGPLGYILSSQAAGTAPLFRDRNDSYSQDVETTKPATGFKVQEVLGFVPTIDGSTGTPPPAGDPILAPGGGAPTPTATPQPTPQPTATPAPLPAELAIYRYTNGQGTNYYAKSASANMPSGFALASNNVVFMVYAEQIPGTVALQRCYQGAARFLSVDPGCEGSPVSPYGPVGYIATSQIAGTIPLYRDRSPDWSKDLETTNATMATKIQEVLGYVPAN